MDALQPTTGAPARRKFQRADFQVNYQPIQIYFSSRFIYDNKGEDTDSTNWVETQ